MATIKQKEVYEWIKKKGFPDDRWDNRWLDVEPAYREAGWIVEYDKPAYCESYEPFFRFMKVSK